jgi:hypothetical protein
MLKVQIGVTGRREKTQRSNEGRPLGIGGQGSLCSENDRVRLCQIKRQQQHAGGQRCSGHDILRAQEVDQLDTCAVRDGRAVGTDVRVTGAAGARP